MKIYCLRTIFETNNLNFSNEEILTSKIACARLVHEIKLPIFSDRVVGIEPDGKRQVEITAVDRVYRGHPLLLEILATDERPDTTKPHQIRPELESRTQELVALLTWTLHGIIDVKLADALFWRYPNDPPNKWNLDDVTRIMVGDFYDDYSVLKAKYEETERIVISLNDPRRSVISMAMRWWRHGLLVSSPVDKFIACWIILEIFSNHISKKESIRSRVKDALSKIFPKLAEDNNGKRVNKLSEVLCEARNKAVHAGYRDLTNLQCLVDIGSTTAFACIKFLIDDSVSGIPREQLLQQLEI